MSGLDRWIIGALTTALAGVLWFILIDGKSQVEKTNIIVGVNSNRITVLESRVDWLERAYLELRDDLRHHREATEKRP